MSNGIWKVWSQRDPLKIHNTPYTLIGYSIAALRTNFYIKELGILLDAGLSANINMDYIFITHAHGDHTANIPFHLLSSKQNTIQIYAPYQAVDHIDKYIRSMFMMSCNIQKEGDLVLKDLYKIHGMNPTIEKINIKNKDYYLEIIECYHAVPCIGFGLTEVKSKLKDEYLGLKGKEIVELKNQGIEIYKEVQQSFFCYLGDTSKEILNNKNLEKYTTIMIECTFLLEEDIKQADETKHMHWSHLYPYIKEHPNTQFIIYHFSQRYSANEIKEFFDKIRNDIPNVTEWISS